MTPDSKTLILWHTPSGWFAGVLWTPDFRTATMMDHWPLMRRMGPFMTDTLALKWCQRQEQD